MAGTGRFRRAWRHLLPGAVPAVLVTASLDVGNLIVTLAALLGGNVRVGLEDSLYLRKGVLATSSAEQVKKIRGILEELSFEIATPDEVRKRLRLKGADQVAI